MSCCPSEKRNLKLQQRSKPDSTHYSVFARSPFSIPHTPLFRSFRSAICNSERSHWMGMPRITNSGPERARKQTLGQRGGRSCKHRIHEKFSLRISASHQCNSTIQRGHLYTVLRKQSCSKHPSDQFCEKRLAKVKAAGKIKTQQAYLLTRQQLLLAHEENPRG